MLVLLFVSYTYLHKGPIYPSEQSDSPAVIMVSAVLTLIPEWLAVMLPLETRVEAFDPRHSNG